MMRRWLTGGIVLVALVAPGLDPAWGQCPQDLCDCLGNANGFAIVAGAAKVGAGTYSEDGFLNVAGTSIDGSACVANAKLRARVDGDGDIAGDLVARAGAGSGAARFRGYKDFGFVSPSFSIAGDILTAGGSVRGTLGIDYDLLGNVIIGGADPRIAACEQAALDIQTASTSFRSMTPVSERYDNLAVNDADRDIHAGPGVQVINVVGDIRVGHYTMVGFSLGRTLNITTDVDTEAVIINVGGNLIVDDDATITSDAAELVVINLTTPKSKVVIGKRATVDVPILAPQSGVLVKVEAATANIWTTRKMALQGATVSDALVCTPDTLPAKTIFVSSDEYDGAMLGSLAGADALCQELADAALLSGTYKAWLSDSNVRAANRLSHPIIPYALVDGTIVADNWGDLSDGSLLHAIDTDEDGLALDPLLDNSQVWTATQALGTALADTCLNWTSGDLLDDGGIGDASSTSSTWTDDDIASCDDLAHLYCIEQ